MMMGMMLMVAIMCVFAVMVMVIARAPRIIAHTMLTSRPAAPTASAS